MAIIYKIDILNELKKKGYNTTRIRKENILGQSAVTALNNNKYINLNTLDRICKLLEMQPGDIIGYEE